MKTKRNIRDRVFVRFKRGKVATRDEFRGKDGIVVVDSDASGDILGAEFIGKKFFWMWHAATIATAAALAMESIKKGMSRNARA